MLVVSRLSRRRSSFLSSFVAHRRCKHLHPAEHGCSCFDNTWRVKTLVINQPSTWLQFSFSLQGHCLPLASGLHPTLSSTPPPPRRSSVLLRLLQSQNPQLECQLLFQSLPHRIAIITKSPKLFATQLPTVLKQITVLVQEWDGAKRLCESLRSLLFATIHRGFIKLACPKYHFSPSRQEVTISGFRRYSRETSLKRQISRQQERLTARRRYRQA